MRRQQGGDHRDEQAGDAVDVADPRRYRRGQTAQRQDETDRGDQVEEGGQVLAHRGPRYRFFWNICSMRWVTIKPPKILTAARVTATKPMIFAKLILTGPDRVTAPTTITLEMALVTLISGESNPGVTPPTPSYPTQ